MIMELTIRELLNQSIRYLKNNGVENNAVLDAQLILSHILNVDRLYLTLHRDKRLEEDTINQYNKLLKLRAEGMPLQYITETQEFMSLPFKVTPDVLIPRGDTEILVEYIVDQCKDIEDKKHVHIMDIGAGSGCITVSLAYYIKNSRLWAVDVSSKALEISRYNARLNGVDNKISFIQHDILEGFPEDKIEGLLDIVVSNPPYIPSKVIDSLQKEVKDYEPHLALDGGEDGLKFYRKIIAEAYKYLKPEGLLAFEVGHDQSSSVAKIMEQNGSYNSIEIIRDLAGINRVVTAKRI
ncbi:MAG: protein-(glutamine-N5) methyltransferase, release factor-specific [Clostridia bacterium]|jgi:release factor glutamine methyltransferase|nr:protein-(glutamine-N5) methyltransferase, release factor-specific [Clostridia bacterium]